MDADEQKRVDRAYRNNEANDSQDLHEVEKMWHSFVSKERVCSHGRDLVPNAVAPDSKVRYERSSSEVKIAQKELGVTLQGGENTACIHHIF